LRSSVDLSRGLAFPKIGERGQEEEIDELTDVISVRSDEDFFLRDESMLCMASLSHFLTQHQKSDDIPPIEPVRNYLINQNREQRAKQELDLLRRYIIPIDSSLRRTLYTACEPEHDILLANSIDTKDPVFFLDYLPLLRYLAVSESIQEYIYNVTKSSDNSDTTDRFRNNRRINTRRSTQRGRQHYLEKIVPAWVWKDTDSQPKDIGEMMTKSSLVYRNVDTTLSV
jgi:hypothetical protein